jgi:hypothetical protein
MQDSISEMRRYFDDEAWPEARKHIETWPSAEWRQLFDDVIRALDVNSAVTPAGDVAQSFATRWRVLDAADTTRPGVRLGLRRAWANRLQWPEALRTRFEGLERVTRFVSEVLWERWDAEHVARERSTGVHARVSEARRRLYRYGATLLGPEPSPDAVRDLLACWAAIVDDEAVGDADMKAEMIRSFKARRQWPAGLVRSTASSYGLDPPTWSGVADLIEAAHDRTMRCEQ